MQASLTRFVSSDRVFYADMRFLSPDRAGASARRLLSDTGEPYNTWESPSFRWFGKRGCSVRRGTGKKLRAGPRYPVRRHTLGRQWGKCHNGIPLYTRGFYTENSPCDIFIDTHLRYRGYIGCFTGFSEKNFHICHKSFPALHHLGSRL